MMAVEREHEDHDEASARRRRQRGRNYAMLALLGGLVVLFHVLTIVRMGGSN